MVGRKRIFLSTNELTLSDHELSLLYAKRWEIEVFFRTVKQNYERSKMESHTPTNVKLEIQWTLLGIWLALTIGGQHIPADKRISPIQILRTLCRLVVDVARKGDRKLNIGKDLSLRVAADESNRRSEKNSESYPRKKRKKPIGVPT